MTTPGVNPCLQLMDLQCSKSVVRRIWSLSGFFSPPQYRFSCIALYCTFHMITGSVSLTLSLTHTCANIAYTNTVPLIAHLTPETSEPWEGPDGRCRLGAGMWVCLCTSRCENEQHPGRLEGEQKVLGVYSCIAACPVLSHSRLGIVFEFSRHVVVSCPFHVAFRCLLRIPVSADLPRRCYRQC